MQPIKRAIRRPEILAKTGVSATTIYNLEKRGEFPQHFMLTPRCAVWFEAEVDAWLDQCMVNPASPAQPSPARAPDVSLRKSSRGRAAAGEDREVRRPYCAPVPSPGAAAVRLCGRYRAGHRRPAVRALP